MHDESSTDGSEDKDTLTEKGQIINSKLAENPSKTLKLIIIFHLLMSISLIVGKRLNAMTKIYRLTFP